MYTADLEVQFDADSDDAAGATLVTLVRLLNTLELSEALHVESYLLLRGETALSVDLQVTEIQRSTRRATLHVLPRNRNDPVEK